MVTLAGNKNKFGAREAQHNIAVPTELSQMAKADEV